MFSKNNNEVTYTPPKIPETAPCREEDVVNHPSHYCQEGSMECIEEMELVFGIEAVMNFCLLNTWKYRKRALYKNKEEDLKKSDWYMNKYKELSEKKESQLRESNIIKFGKIAASTVPLKFED